MERHVCDTHSTYEHDCPVIAYILLLLLILLCVCNTQDVPGKTAHFSVHHVNATIQDKMKWFSAKCSKFIRLKIQMQFLCS